MQDDTLTSAWKVILPSKTPCSLSISAKFVTLSAVNQNKKKNRRKQVNVAFSTVELKQTAFLYLHM